MVKREQGKKSVRSVRGMLSDVEYQKLNEVIKNFLDLCESNPIMFIPLGVAILRLLS